MKITLLFLSIMIFFVCCDVEAIHILNTSSNTYHRALSASINGDITETTITSLSGVNLSSYDAIYINEHTSTTFFSGYETAVRNAISSGSLGLFMEYAGIDIINNLLNINVTLATLGSSMSLTTLGSTHPMITGTGLLNGRAVSNLSDLNEWRQSYSASSVSGFTTNRVA